jgi:hypothetical protein
MRTVALYLSGSIRKGKEDEAKLCWGKEERDFIRNELEGYDVVLLDPQFGGDHLKDAQAAFGRDMMLVTSSDVLLVDARQRRGVGVGTEMLMAKLRGIPVVSIVPKNTHYHRDRIEYLGTEVRNYQHPFVFSLSDAVVEDLAAAMEWVKDHLLSPRPVKGIHVIEDAIRQYRQAHFEGEKRKTKEFLSGRQ